MLDEEREEDEEQPALVGHRQLPCGADKADGQVELARNFQHVFPCDWGRRAVVDDHFGLTGVQGPVVAHVHGGDDPLRGKVRGGGTQGLLDQDYRRVRVEVIVPDVMDHPGVEPACRGKERAEDHVKIVVGEAIGDIATEEWKRRPCGVGVIVDLRRPCGDRS